MNIPERKSLMALLNQTRIINLFYLKHQAPDSGYNFIVIRDLNAYDKSDYIPKLY